MTRYNTFVDSKINFMTRNRDYNFYKSKTEGVYCALIHSNDNYDIYIILINIALLGLIITIKIKTMQKKYVKY